MKTQIIILFLLFSTTATYAQRPADSAKYKPWVFTEMKIAGDTVLHFSTENEPTKYEIYDANGNVVHKGEGKGVKVKELKKGIYYINFYVEMGKFLKK